MKRLIVAVILGLIIIGLAAAWWKNGLQPAEKANNTPQIFVIEKGQGVREISANLKKKGLIKDQIVFFLLVKELGLDKQIEAGSFRLNPSMSTSEIANNLTHGILDIWVTIPEGLRAEEITDLLKEKIPSYKESWRQTLIENEGYLFPDTYLIPKDATIDSVVNILKNNFETKFNSVKNSKITGLSDKDVIIVASLVEREAKFAKDRPIVAAVIENRLRQDIPLGIDATIQYALGYDQNEKTWWKKELTDSDLKIKSPYNTRANYGLPPTPIANPGLDAISASLNPPSTRYLYYVSDKTGNLHYSETLSEHNDNIKKFGL